MSVESKAGAAHVRAIREAMKESRPMLDKKLTIEDRTNPRRCAERFAHGVFTGPESSQWVLDGRIPMTEDMLAHLLAEVYAIGFDAGAAVERERRRGTVLIATGPMSAVRAKEDRPMVIEVEACACGHSPEAHGHDTKHPRSTACTECGCIAYECCEDHDLSGRACPQRGIR